MHCAHAAPQVMGEWALGCDHDKPDPFYKQIKKPVSMSKPLSILDPPAFCGVPGDLYMGALYKRVMDMAATVQPSQALSKGCSLDLALCCTLHLAARLVEP